MSEEQIKMLRPTQVEIPGTKETFTPMRHVLAVDKESRGAEIPPQLQGGGKLSEIPRERLEGPLNNLLAHMQSQPEMYWPMSWKASAKSVSIFTSSGAASTVVDTWSLFASRTCGIVDATWC